MSLSQDESAYIRRSRRVRPPYRLPFVQEFRDPWGHPRYYFRRQGFKRVPLPGLIGSDEFMRVYIEAYLAAPAGSDD